MLCIVGNLSVVSILLSNRKSHRYFNAFLALYCRQSIRPLNVFLKWKIKPLFQQCFGLGLRVIYPLFQFLCHMEKLTVASTVFWLLLVRQSIRRFNSFLKCKSHRFFNNLLAFDCRSSIRCFNSFVKCEISPLFQRFFCFVL